MPGDSDTKPHTSSPLPHQPKVRSAVPSYLLNGNFPTPVSTKTTTRAREIESLTSSIRATYDRRPILDMSGLGATDSYNEVDGTEADNARDEPAVNRRSEKAVQKPARDKRDNVGATQAVASRPQSPYTAAPPIDFDGLSWPCIGTRDRLEQTPEQAQARLDKISGAVRTILEAIGEDPDREGLVDTPERYAKALLFFSKGYEENVRDIMGAVFNEDHDELVIVKDIEVYSLCEHHLVPFIGKMSIGYIPNKTVMGLSKLARLAEMFSRRLQVQERLTKQVALAIAEVLKPQGIAVVMESSHLCMVMRGVQKTGSTTTTSCMLGAMRRSSKTREEFLSLLNRK